MKHLFPMLETENLEQTIEFYTYFLGFECRGVYPPENPCWASLWNGDTEIAFGLPNASTNFEKSLMTGSIYLNVENVEEIWQKLKDKVEIVYPLENFDYGMREFGIRDCNGYVLNLGQNIE
ncbi:MAG: VOC family protein [Actinomycetota bacterium]